MEAASSLQLVRELARSIDCLSEEDVALLAGVALSTVSDWRRRRKGPPFTRLGTRFLYPRAGVEQYVKERVSELPRAGASKGVL